MHLRKWRVVILGSILFLLLAALWSKGVVDLVFWWWRELFATRAMMGSTKR